MELIGNLRQTGDLDAVRKAREKMYELFPLTEGECGAVCADGVCVCVCVCVMMVTCVCGDGVVCSM